MPIRGPLAVTLLFILVLVIKTLTREQKKRLPPGPGGLPVVGSVHELPMQFQEKKYYEWSQRYGDVIYFKVFRTSMIVLSTIEAARDLLDKRSSKYSCRPRMVALAEMYGQESALPTIPYGERLRKIRKWIYDGVGNKHKLGSYRPIQRREVLNLSRNLLEDPARFFDHFHLYIAAIMVEVTYGFRVTSLQDELVQVAERGLNGVVAGGNPGSRLVDFFPILKHMPTWLPGSGFAREAQMIRGYIMAWKNAGYDRVMSAMASGTTTPCIFTNILGTYGQEGPIPAELEDVKGVNFNVYGGALCTSRGALAMFLLNMTRNPHVYRKAQEEMDKVLGKRRLPDFSDRESLPYLDALLEEVYRWNPALPIGLPHRVVDEDQYRGYDIPAGSMIIANTWAMTRDTRYYPEPDAFRPERYLAPAGEKSDVLLPSSFVFGFGRRICPGQAFADASIWLAIAHIVALFDIKKAIDDAGNEITPPAEFISGFTSQAAPFICRIIPRSDLPVAAMLAQIEA
ncbi:cytochrome P450 [Pilatotrama ljubarskyi]|nr:cytochrome P450 [Pilatotrama ljubarskyi]